MRLAGLFAQEQLRQQTAKPPMPGKVKPKPGMQRPGMPNDQSDFQKPGTQQQGVQPGQQQPGAGPTPEQAQSPELQAAPYVKLLSKLGYEFMNQDQDMDGNQIGQTFQGEDGDTIVVKQDGSWIRFGPGAQRSQGPDVKSLGNNLVSNSLQQGDDQNTNSALRQAGYQKFHQDEQGNTYYKHPQTGNTVAVQKSGKWGSSTGTGRGANKLRDFLGNEQAQNQDPQMQKMKMQQQQMKMQQKQMRQGGGSMTPQRGTRGQPGTRQPMGGGGQCKPTGGGF